MKEIKTIGIIAPSGNIKDKKLVDDNISKLSEKFLVKKFYDENVSLGYVSDSVDNRIDYLYQAFLDKDVDMVISLRGGYGAIEVVDRIDYEKIKNSNKIYLASSDATILLLALYKNTNIKCFHSLMITNGFVQNLADNIEIVKNDLFKLNLTKINKNKAAKGILWGGNLSSLVSLFSGNCFLPDEDIILFLEDLNEPMYKLDKMMYEIYRNQKLKEKIKGIIFGDFYFSDEEISPLLLKYASLFDVAAFKTNQITHKENNVTIQIGHRLSL